MDKKDYLIKTLSRTNRKDYENYVVGAIYHKLGNINIQPVSQQYVKTEENGYSLLDLYFPQINYAIECDESYHLKNKENDELREIGIRQKLSALTEAPLTQKHIDMTKSIEEINKQIDEIVEDIQRKYKDIGSPIWEDQDPVELALQSKHISIKDNLSFKTITDVLKLFGKEYKKYYRGSCKLNEETIVWFPHLSIIHEDGTVGSTTQSGWINTLSNDWKYIYESHNSKVTKENYGEDLFNVKRIVFAKSKDCLGEDAYRFLGIYKMKEFRENERVVYELIKDEMDLKEYLL